MENAKLAVCDGLSRKAPEEKKASQRKLRFDDTSPSHMPDRERYSIVDYARIAVCDDRALKAFESKNITRVDSTQIFKDVQDCAEEIVRSVSMNSLAECVESIGVTSWWEQDRKTVSQEKPMRENILVSNQLASFLCGTANRKDMHDQKHTVLKTVEDACNVELTLHRCLGDDKMRNLAITGSGDERDQAKSMIVRLGASCRTDTLETVMDAWNEDQWSARSCVHAFMSARGGHEFDGFTSARDSARSETERDHRSMRGDMKSLRAERMEKGWRKEMRKFGCRT
jgi:hypothetical protein